MKRNSRIYIFRLGISMVCCFFSAVVFAQQGARVKAAADSTAIRIGEQFHLHLDAVVDSTQGTLYWAQVPDSFDHVLVVQRSPIDTVTSGGNKHYHQQITLTSFDSGQWQIPAFDFRVISKHAGDSAVTATTDSLSIYVNTVPVDTTKPFNPIKSIRLVPFNLLDYWPYLLGGIVLVALLIWLLFFRKKKKKETPVDTTPKEPAYVLAEKSLHALEAEELWQKDQVKLYYTRLTDILRLYLERQFNVNALEQTSDELLENIKPVTRLNQQRSSLQYILQTADLAKFAKLQPLPEDHEACMRKAYDFVEWTKPKPQDETPGAHPEKAKNQP